MTDILELDRARVFVKQPMVLKEINCKEFISSHFRIARLQMRFSTKEQQAAAGNSLNPQSSNTMGALEMSENFPTF